MFAVNGKELREAVRAVSKACDTSYQKTEFVKFDFNNQVLTVSAYNTHLIMERQLQYTIDKCENKPVSFLVRPFEVPKCMTAEFTIDDHTKEVIIDFGEPYMTMVLHIEEGDFPRLVKGMRLPEKVESSIAFDANLLKKALVNVKGNVRLNIYETLRPMIIEEIGDGGKVYGKRTVFPIRLSNK